MSANGDAVSPSLKRPLPDDQPNIPTTPFKMAKLQTLDVFLKPKEATESVELPSAPESPLSSVPGNMSPRPGQPSGTPTGAGQKRKRRTAAEVEVEKRLKEAERETKRIALEEKRVKREEEDRIKQEEKRKRAEEQEEKRRAKEQEAAIKEQEKEEKRRAKEQQLEAKEQEKLRKVEEQEKKEKSQLRLSNFFAAKPTPKPNPTVTAGAIAEDPTQTISHEAPTISDYRAKFLPFNLGSNVHVPKNYFDKLQREFPPLDLTTTPAVPLSFGPPIKRGWEQPSMKYIINQLQGGSSNPIDLTTEQERSTQANAVRLAKRTSVKFIYFSENVRPAYFGTYTRPASFARLRKLGRSPYSGMDHLNYDYDSEAEWEEGGSEDGGGEDIDFDGDEEEDDGENDMEGFVDDEEFGPGGLKRQPVFSGGMDLTPACTGLLWEDEKGALRSADGNPLTLDLKSLEMMFFLFPESKTVDPFSREYWEPTPSSEPTSPKANETNLPAPGFRPALMDKTKHLNTLMPSNLKAARYLPEAELEAFKLAIDGQDLTKIAMIEHLKKLFPKQPKDSIVNTLGAVAERESKKATAKWRIKTT